MSRHLCCTALVMVAFLVAVPVNAQTTAKDISDSGNRYVEICSSYEKPSAQWNEMDFLNGGVCQGFMLGLRDGISLSLFMLKQSGNSGTSLKGSEEDFGICVPDGVELGQMIHIALKYIRENPEQAHQRSAQLVVVAEQRAFPCAKPKQ